MLQGLYQRGGDSAQIPAHLQIDAQGRVRCPEADIDNVAFSVIDVSTRIANTSRYLNFPDGGCFETDDNDAVDRWLREHRHSGRGSLFVHHLEAKARYVIAAALVTVLFAFGFVNWGLPWLSKQAAYALPQEVSASLGRGTLEFLDAHLLTPTQLPPDRQKELFDLFERLRPDDGGFEFKLALRSSDVVGANAFALPDGTIMITDELVKLAANDEQIGGVMLHEIAHVVGRHGLRSALQSAGLATLLVLIAGDVSSANSFLVTLPALLVQTAHSREMETEADLFAVQAMQARKMDPGQMIAMLHQLEQSHDLADPDADDNDGSWLDYLSTHPLGEERLRPLQEAINKGQTATDLRADAEW